MAESENKKKMESLQQYVPFLNTMIEQLKEPSQSGKEKQLNKIQSLHSIITEKKKLKMETLNRCEAVILQLINRTKSRTQAIATTSLVPSTSTSDVPTTATRTPVKKSVFNRLGDKITSPSEPSVGSSAPNYQPSFEDELVACNGLVQKRQLSDDETKNLDSKSLIATRTSKETRDVENVKSTEGWESLKNEDNPEDKIRDFINAELSVFMKKLPTTMTSNNSVLPDIVKDTSQNTNSVSPNSAIKNDFSSSTTPVAKNEHNINTLNNEDFLNAEFSRSVSEVINQTPPSRNLSVVDMSISSDDSCDISFSVVSPQQSKIPVGSVTFPSGFTDCDAVAGYVNKKIGSESSGSEKTLVRVSNILLPPPIIPIHLKAIYGAVDNVNQNVTNVINQVGNTISKVGSPTPSEFPPTLSPQCDRSSNHLQDIYRGSRPPTLSPMSRYSPERKSPSYIRNWSSSSDQHRNFEHNYRTTGKSPVKSRSKSPRRRRSKSIFPDRYRRRPKDCHWSRSPYTIRRSPRDRRSRSKSVDRYRGRTKECRISRSRSPDSKRTFRRRSRSMSPSKYRPKSRGPDYRRSKSIGPKRSLPAGRRSRSVTPNRYRRKSRERRYSRTKSIVPKGRWSRSPDGPRREANNSKTDQNKSLDSKRTMLYDNRPSGSKTPYRSRRNARELRSSSAEPKSKSKISDHDRKTRRSRSTSRYRKRSRSKSTEEKQISIEKCTIVQSELPWAKQDLPNLRRSKSKSVEQISKTSEKSCSATKSPEKESGNLKEPETVVPRVKESKNEESEVEIGPFTTGSLGNENKEVVKKESASTDKNQMPPCDQSENKITEVQSQIINNFLKKLLEDERTRAAASMLIENVANDLDGELMAVLQAFKSESPEAVVRPRVSITTRKQKPIIESDEESVGEEIVKKKKPRNIKTELDLLHEDIRRMFNDEDLLVSNSRRMCRLQKSKENEVAKSEYFDCEDWKNSKKLKHMMSAFVSITRIPQKSDDVNVRTSEEKVDSERNYLLRRLDRCSVNYLEIDSGNERKLRKRSRELEEGEEKYNLRRSDRPKYVYPEFHSDIEAKIETKKLSPQIKTPNKHKEKENKMASPDRTRKRVESNTEVTTPTSSKKNIHKKRGKAWASGIVPKFKRRKKEEPIRTTPKESKKVPEAVESNETNTVPEMAKETITTESDQLEETYSIVTSSEEKNEEVVTTATKELEEASSVIFTEPDKRYSFEFAIRHFGFCKLCTFRGRHLTQHYRLMHPEHEVLSSRLSPRRAEEAIQESIALKLDEKSEETSAYIKTKYKCQCRFCNRVFSCGVSKFYEHISTHTGEFRINCQLCTWGATNAKHLSQHYLKHHKMEAPNYTLSPIKRRIYGYICVDCNYVQMNKKAVEDHVNIYHLGEGKKVLRIYLSALDREMYHLKFEEPLNTEAVGVHKNSDAKIKCYKACPLSVKRKMEEQQALEGKGDELPVKKRNTDEDGKENSNSEEGADQEKRQLIKVVDLQSLIEDGDKVVSSEENKIQKDSTQTETKHLGIEKGNLQVSSLESAQNEGESLNKCGRPVATVQKEDDSVVKTGNVKEDVRKPNAYSMRIVEQLKNRLNMLLDCENFKTKETEVTSRREEVEKTETEETELLTAGFLDVVKGDSELQYICKLPKCLFSSKDHSKFFDHWKNDHKEVSNYKVTTCLICRNTISVARKQNLLTHFLTHVEVEHLGIDRCIETENQNTSNNAVEQMENHQITLKNENKVEAQSTELENDPLPNESDVKFMISTSYLVVVGMSESLLYICRLPNCKMQTKDGERLLNHWKVNHSDAKMTTCSICDNGIYFKHLSDYFEHVDKTHVRHKKESLFSFRIVEVMSLAEDTSTAQQEKQSDPLLRIKQMVKSLQVSTYGNPDTFLKNPDKLYKCPHQGCYFCTDEKGAFTDHIKIHTVPKDEIVSCVYCDLKMVISKNSFHVERYHGNCRYSCSLCLYRAVRKEYVVIHMKKCHTSEIKVITFAPKSINTGLSKQKLTVSQACHPYKCGAKDCFSEFLYQNEYIFHLSNFHDHMVCGYKTGPKQCGFKCQQEAIMMDHWRIHDCHSFTCLVCKKGGTNLQMMLEHYSQTHPNLEPLVVDRRRASKDTKVYGYTADACIAIRYVRDELFNIIKDIPYTVEELQPPAPPVIEIDSSDDEENRTEPRPVNEEFSEEMLANKYGKICLPIQDEFRCPLCLEFTTKKLANFVYHLLVELKCDRYKCSSCHYSCIQLDTLLAHCRDNHNSTTPVTLTELPIDKKVEYWIEMVLKLQSKVIVEGGSVPTGRTNQSPFYNTPCDVCQKWFRNIETLNEHEVYHWADVTFVCDHCSARRTSLDEVFQHIRRKHPNGEYSISAIAPSLVIPLWKRFPSKAMVSPQPTTVDSSELLYGCLQCPVVMMKTMEELKKHQMENHGDDGNNFSCRILKKTETDIDLLCVVPKT